LVGREFFDDAVPRTLRGGSQSLACRIVSVVALDHPNIEHEHHDAERGHHREARPEVGPRKVIEISDRSASSGR